MKFTDMEIEDIKQPARCPKCGDDQYILHHVTNHDASNVIERRLECLVCHHAYEDKCNVPAEAA